MKKYILSHLLQDLDNETLANRLAYLLDNDSIEKLYKGFPVEILSYDELSLISNLKAKNSPRVMNEVQINKISPRDNTFHVAYEFLDSNGNKRSEWDYMECIPQATFKMV